MILNDKQSGRRIKAIVTIVGMCVLGQWCFEGPVVGQSPCGSTSLINESNAGMWRARGVTAVPSACGSNTEAIVWVYIPGPNMYCSTGNWTNDGQCTKTHSDPASATAYLAGRGPNVAYSSHSRSYNTTTILSDDAKPIYSQTEEEECEEDPFSRWDESSGVCEYNPDGPGSPIIVATGKSAAYKLTSAEDGVLFDINGDGVRERIAWTEAGSDTAFLALDRNGDGVINDGRELFGNFTLPGAKHGFEALLQLTMESNGGVMRATVSSDDPIYSKLQLWTDKNHNGVSESDELRPAFETIAEIALGYQLNQRKDGHGNLFLYRGWVYLRTAPGRNRPRTPAEHKERMRLIYDVFLQILK